MREPKRYDVSREGLVLNPNGYWCEYAEYVYVQAENARLKAEVAKQIEAALPPIEAYIAKLEAENTRLKAEVESLKKPAVIGGYNISEYIRMANSETLEFDNGDLFADMTLPERIKYIVESHARLKAECQARQAENSVLAVECDSLKAEVERLTKELSKALTDFWHIHEGYFRLQAEVNRLTAFTTRTIIPNEELQAQVERLTKAGDAMASSIQFNEEMAKDYNGPTIVHKSVQRWNAAKEGKQP